MAATDARTIKPGESAFLIPRSIAASADCWRNAPCVVIEGPTNGTFLVRLNDSREIRVHEIDVVRNLPNPPKERAPRPRPRPQYDGAEEVPLW